MHAYQLQSINITSDINQSPPFAGCQLDTEALDRSHSSVCGLFLFRTTTYPNHGSPRHPYGYGRVDLQEIQIQICSAKLCRHVAAGALATVSAPGPRNSCAVDRTLDAMVSQEQLDGQCTYTRALAQAHHQLSLRS